MALTHLPNANVLALDHADSAALLRSVLDSQFKDIPESIAELPKRRTHSQRPEAQKIAKTLFPGYGPEKALILYELLRSKANSTLIKRAAQDKGWEEYDQQKWVKVMHEPWNPDANPANTADLKALPMLVKVGPSSEFADVFASLKADVQNDWVSSSVSDTKLFPGSKPGLEAVSNTTPLLEFKRGVVYEDGRLDLCRMVVGPDHIDELMDTLDTNSSVRHFLLGNNIISNRGARRIARFIREHPGRMETCYLAGNHIKDNGLKDITWAL
ncbi:hypothetical protein LTS18_004544 [Coniosporium uncinatum]|uniref:Uncharacterized protein n=1 Tax=Coniosporium uncinatum TaxID=93489 RepID=A0ACC3D5N4_9PEZI|nr:hypothetical protein LTS18_004544 [Coniosporium uncinatum]